MVLLLKYRWVGEENKLWNIFVEELEIPNNISKYKERGSFMEESMGKISMSVDNSREMCAPSLSQSRLWAHTRKKPLLGILHSVACKMNIIECQ